MFMVMIKVKRGVRVRVWGGHKREGVARKWELSLTYRAALDRDIVESHIAGIRITRFSYKFKSAGSVRCM